MINVKTECYEQVKVQVRSQMVNQVVYQVVMYVREKLWSMRGLQVKWNIEEGLE